MHLIINTFHHIQKDHLEDKIVQGKIKFNDGKELRFKCNEDPMCNFCDKNLCRTRKFGIGGESVFPVLSDLQKVLLDEPYYWVNVDGDRVKLDTIDYLMEQRLFRRTVAKQLNKKPKRVTTKEFETYIDMLLQGVEEVDAPEGSSKIDQLKQSFRRLLFTKIYWICHKKRYFKWCSVYRKRQTRIYIS